MTLSSFLALPDQDSSLWDI